MHHLPSKALLPFELHALQAGLYYSMTSLPVSLPLAVSVSVCLSRSLSLSLSRAVSVSVDAKWKQMHVSNYA